MGRSELTVRTQPCVFESTAWILNCAVPVMSPRSGMVSLASLPSHVTFSSHVLCVAAAAEREKMLADKAAVTVLCPLPL